LIDEVLCSKDLIEHEAHMMTRPPVHMHQDGSRRSQHSVCLTQSRREKVAIGICIDKSIIKVQTLATLATDARIEWRIEIDQINRTRDHERQFVKTIAMP